MTGGSLSGSLDGMKHETEDTVPVRSDAGKPGADALHEEPAYKLTDELGQHVGPFMIEDVAEQLFRVVLPVCKPCLLGEGEVCHTPGCMMIRREVWGPMCDALGAPGGEAVQAELLAEMNRRYGPFTEISEAEFVEASKLD